MTAVTYSLLVADKDTEGSIKSWVSNTKTPSTLVLNMGEQYIFQRLRVREMLTVSADTLAAAASSIAVPDRYRTPECLWFIGNEKRQLDHRTLNDVEAARNYVDAAGTLATEPPTCFFASGDAIELNAKADKAYPYRFWHYAALAPLSSGNPTNFLTDKYADMLYAACCFRHALFWKDRENMEIYGPMVDGLIERANMEYDEEKGRGLIADIVVR